MGHAFFSSGLHFGSQNGSTKPSIEKHEWANAAQYHHHIMSISVLFPTPAATSLTNHIPTTRTTFIKTQQSVSAMMPRPDPTTTITPSADDDDNETITLPDNFIPRKIDGEFCF